MCVMQVSEDPIVHTHYSKRALRYNPNSPAPSVPSAHLPFILSFPLASRVILHNIYYLSCCLAIALPALVSFHLLRRIGMVKTDKTFLKEFTIDYFRVAVLLFRRPIIGICDRRSLTIMLSLVY